VTTVNHIIYTFIFPL